MKVQVLLRLTSETHAVRVNDLMNQFHSRWANYEFKKYD